MGKAAGASSPFTDEHTCRVDQLLRVAAPARFGLVIEHLDARGGGSLYLDLVTLPDLYLPSGPNTGNATSIVGHPGLAVSGGTRDRLDLVDGVLWISRNGAAPTKVDGIALQTYLGFSVSYSNTGSADDWSYFFRVWYYIDP